MSEVQMVPPQFRLTVDHATKLLENEKVDTSNIEKAYNDALEIYNWYHKIIQDTGPFDISFRHMSDHREIMSHTLEALVIIGNIPVETYAKRLDVLGTFKSTPGKPDDYHLQVWMPFWVEHKGHINSGTWLERQMERWHADVKGRRTYAIDYVVV